MVGRHGAGGVNWGKLGVNGGCELGAGRSLGSGGDRVVCTYLLEIGLNQYTIWGGRFRAPHSPQGGERGKRKGLRGEGPRRACVTFKKKRAVYRRRYKLS